MRKYIIVFALLFLVSGCGSSQSSNNSTGSLSGGWLHSYSNSVDFLQLAVVGSQISGTVQYASIEGPQPHLNQVNTSVSGTFNGQQVTLTVSYWNFPVATYSGNYANDTLTMTVPNQDGSLSTADYNHASIDDYNNAVQQLQQSLNQQIQSYNNNAATAIPYRLLCTNVQLKTPLCAQHLELALPRPLLSMCSHVGLRKRAV